MSARRIALVLAVLPTLLVAACVNSSILDPAAKPVILPALEPVPYDSLAGAKIAFQRFGPPAGYFQGVYVIDARAARVQALLANWSIDRGQLSVDGTTLLFGAASGAGLGPFDIYLVTLADSTQARITSGALDEQAPSWSADGAQIYYYVRGNAQTTLYRQSPIANPVDRVATVLNDSGPVTWNLDGPVSVNTASRLAFGTFGSGFRIWTMNSDGTGGVIVKTDPAVIGPIFQSPTWSPDGTKIAYLQLNHDANGRVTSTALKTIDPNGTGEATVATVATTGYLFGPNSVSDFSLCYTGPAGSRIVFTSLGADGTSHVYVVRPTGGPVTQITTNSGVWDRGVSCRH